MNTLKMVLDNLPETTDREEKRLRQWQTKALKERWTRILNDAAQFDEREYGGRPDRTGSVDTRAAHALHLPRLRPEPNHDDERNAEPTGHRADVQHRDRKRRRAAGGGDRAADPM